MRTLSRKTLVRPLLFAVFGAIALGGCASDSAFTASSAFADPAAYDLYDCKRLGPHRVALAAREKQVHDLMAKAQEGTGGAVMSEIGYRSDLLSIQGNRQYAERAWVEKGCERQMAAGAPAAR